MGEKRTSQSFEKGAKKRRELSNWFLSNRKRKSTQDEASCKKLKEKYTPSPEFFDWIYWRVPLPPLSTQGVKRKLRIE
jgi:hypothetical protein